MTKNQIEYQKMQETRRANRVTERLGLDTFQETARHNTQVELQARDNLAEQYRNNVAQLQELQRSHLASEGLAYARLQHDQTALKETERHNIQSERVQELSANLARLNAQTSAEAHVAAAEISSLAQRYSSDNALYSGQLSAAAHTTAAGINAAASQYASDNALLAKQLDIDLNKYGIDTTAAIRRSELGETARANRVRETEVNRSNVASESLKAGSLLESVRNNLVTNRQQQAKISADINLRSQQNAINQQLADQQAKQIDANVSLVPSQKFVNYTRGLNSLSNALSEPVSKLASALKKGK